MSLGLPDISRGDEKLSFRLRKTTSDISFIRRRPKKNLQQPRRKSTTNIASSKTIKDAISAAASASPTRGGQQVAIADQELEALLKDVNAMTNGVDKLLHKLRFRQPRATSMRRSTHRDRHSVFGATKRNTKKSRIRSASKSIMRRSTRSLPNLGSIKKLMAKRQRKKKKNLDKMIEESDGVHDSYFNDLALSGSMKHKPKEGAVRTVARTVIRNAPKSATARPSSARADMSRSSNLAKSERSINLARGGGKSAAARPTPKSAATICGSPRRGPSMQHGVCSIAGYDYDSITQKRNQDSFIVVDNFIEKGQMLFAVFDGHGPQGGRVSRFCSASIAQLLTKLKFTPERANVTFQSAFLRLQRMLHNAPFDSVTSGSTALVCVITPKDRPERKIIVASIGDSRCCICTTDNKVMEDTADAGSTRLKRMMVKAEFLPPLTHAPDEPDEAKRIIHAGGYVWQGPGDVCRVWLSDPEDPDTDPCGIAMSRSLGDFQMHMVGVTCIPDVVTRTLCSAQLKKAETASGHTPFVVLGTDGVWDQFQLDEVANWLYRDNPNPSLLNAAKSNLAPATSAKERCFQLCKESVSRWKSSDSGRVDDVSAIVIKL